MANVHRILQHLRRIPWIYGMPLLLLSFESATNTSHLFEQYHYIIAFRDQPILTLLYLFVSVLRMYAIYLSFVTLFELSVTFLPSRLRHFCLPGYSRHLFFLLLYGLATREVFVQSPSVSMYYNYYLPRVVTLVSGGFLLGYLVNILYRRAWPRPAPLVSSIQLLSVLVATFAFLLVTRTSPSEQNVSPLRSSSPLRPSFLLIGFDGLPQDSFEAQSGGQAAAPRWKSHWKRRALNFNNAYSVTNSTFTSWFSILSGRYPFRSGVETLYPHHREGSQPLDRLLPHQLQQRGYRTVFMTDCGTTSYMKTEYGFDTLYQLAPGLFQCGQSLLTSKHPLAWFMDLGDLRDWLVPELNSFCSAQYRPSDFFKRVHAVLSELNQQPQPYFLAVHSCASHQSMLHQPSMDSPLRHAMTPELYNHSERLKSLMLSIRVADFHLDNLLRHAHETTRPLWTFFFADHGTRIDKIGGELKYFTHAMGLPVNRFQYKVPLAVWGPSLSGTENPALASLMDIYPTVLGLGGVGSRESDGESLLELSPNDRSRSLLLTSAMPLVLSPNNRDMFDAFWENRVDVGGFHHFPLELEARLTRTRPIAFLKPPYRLLLNPGNPLSLYREDADPYDTKNWAPELPGIAEALYQQLCRVYQGPGCRPQLSE